MTPREGNYDMSQMHLLPLAYRWLSRPLLTSRERPVPLIEGVLDRRGTFQFVDVNGETKMEALLPAHQIAQRRDKPSSQDVIVPLAKQLIAKGEKLLVFRNMRRPAQGCARTRNIGLWRRRYLVRSNARLGRGRFGKLLRMARCKFFQDETPSLRASRASFRAAHGVVYA